MLGVVNGRNNFDLIDTIRVSRDDGGRHCFVYDPNDRLSSATDVSEQKQQEAVVTTESDSSFKNNVKEWSSFPFHEIPMTVISSTLKKCASRRCQQERNGIFNRESLHGYSIKECKQIVKNMLEREEEMRLHPSVQAAYGRIGEDETSMVSFTTALQSCVATEFNVECDLGIELIRSAASLFPDIAKNVSHYVCHNRSFRGNLKRGDIAPDVPLSTLEGKQTTLWTEIEKKNDTNHHHTHSSSKNLSDAMTTSTSTNTITKPTVIIGASYT